MSAISIGLSNTAPAQWQTPAYAVITGLNNGLAIPGDQLGVHLSTGASILTYAWGSTPGASDYGTGATLTVPDIPAGSDLHVTLDTATDQITARISIGTASPEETDIRAGLNAILVESLAPRLEPALTLSGGTNTITVEIS